MKKLNSELKNLALGALRGNWTESVITYLVFTLIVVASSFIPWIGWVGSLFIGIPLGYGIYIYFLKRLRQEEVELTNIFEGFKDYGRVLGTGLLMQIYVILWMLLLIIPGIIKSYSYSMTYYILADYPELKYNQAIELSMKIMTGNKMRLFILHLSFIGWFFLAIFTLGIGYLWLSPYVYTTQAAFYQDLKAEHLEDYTN